MDEVLYNLYPDELKTVIPVIEQCMISGMRQVCPDVKVGVETECMLHWDKNATVFTDLKWSDDGKPLVDEPPYVQQLNVRKKENENID